MSPAEEQFDALPKQLVTYAVGNATANVMAVLGRSKMEVDGPGGAIIQVPSHDFIVRASDLVISNAIVTPAKGHTVAYTLAGRTYTYQLMMPPFDPHDHAGCFLRLHSKRINTA
jgi:hypothetical protein